VVRAIRASGQRREHFLAVIRDGNTNLHFSVGTHTGVQVKENQLLCDVKTWWDLVYYMI
jgi:hypothetical protein